MNHSQVGLILLAAGESKRMGSPKQLLFYRGRSLIRYVTEEAVASNCDPIVVVIGAYSDRIQPELDNLPVCICYNQQWQKGMSSSIAIGIQSSVVTQPDIDAVIVALADQPLITAKIYNQLIESYDSTKQKVIACAYAQTIGVPALFARDLFSQLNHLQGQGGAKQLLNRYSDPKINLNIPEAALDLDTPANYHQLRSLGCNTDGT